MNNCCNNNCCDPCGKQCSDPCGCPLRVLSVETIADMPGYVKFNLDGGTVLFDFTPVVKTAETKTTFTVDQVNRLLKYTSESGLQNITAQALGSILRLGDIGDVNNNGVLNNSLLAYQKNSNCGEGCDEVSNQWVPFSATEHIEDTGTYPMIFDEDGVPGVLGTPAHTSQYYNVAWRAGDKLGYTQPVEVSVPTADSDGFSYLTFVNPTTKQMEMLKVVTSIDASGNVTFNLNGGE